MAMAPIIMTAVSTAMSVSTANQEAGQKAAMNNYNAAVARNNATASMQQANADAAQQSREADKALGNIRASYGASGVSQEGSPIDVLAESTQNAVMDNLNIKYKGYVRSKGYTDQSNLDTYGASVALKEGQDKSAAAFIGGASKTYGAYKSA